MIEPIDENVNDGGGGTPINVPKIPKISFWKKILNFFKKIFGIK